MELCLLHHPLKPTFFHHSLSSLPTTGKRCSYRNTSLLGCRCSSSSSSSLDRPAQNFSSRDEGRRALMCCLLAAAAGISFSEAASAASTSRRALRGAKIPESEYTTLPNGLKYYDLKVGGGAEAVKGSRVAVGNQEVEKRVNVLGLFLACIIEQSDYFVRVHYVAKWKGITFMTSRQGMGVGGGTPYGFDVGQSERGTVLKGLDLGVQGMRVGGQRLLIVPPQLAYGNKGVQEIPPNATIELDVELLSIKESPFGSAVKIVEG